MAEGFMNLSEYAELLAYDAAFWMAGLNDPAYPIEDLGPLSLEVSDKLRALAAISLLTRGDSDLYCHNLIRSGLAREKYLRRCRDEGLFGDHHRVSGRYLPLLDAVAAGEFDLAARIVALSPENFHAHHEYEDDYCYAQIIHGFIRGRTPAPDYQPFMERFEAYLDDLDNPRFRLCQALAEGRQDAFDDGFDQLLDEHESVIIAARERGQVEDPQVMTQRRVFVEGLALLRIAERVGLATRADYRYCPSLARMPMKTPFPGE